MRQDRSFPAVLTRNLSSYRFKVNLAWPGDTLKVSSLRSVFEQQKLEMGLFMGPQAAFCRHRGGIFGMPG